MDGWIDGWMHGSRYAQERECVCVQLCLKELIRKLQGHQGCATWPDATKLQSHIRIWSGDALTTYLHFACDVMYGSSLCIVYSGHSLS